MKKIFVLEFLVFPIDFTSVGQDFLVLRKGPEKKPLTCYGFLSKSMGKQNADVKYCPISTI